MKKLCYPAIFTPCEELEGYTVEFPDLPGCVTEGRDIVQAIEMAQDAANGWLLLELEEGNQLPAGSDISSIKTTGKSFANMIVLDIESYAEQYGTKAVRRNITLPAWISTYVDKNNISCSKVLQDALLSLASKSTN